MDHVQTWDEPSHATLVGIHVTCFISPPALRTSPRWQGSLRSTSKRAKFTSLFRPRRPCSLAPTAPRSGRWTLTPENAGRTRWWAGRPRKKVPNNLFCSTFNSDQQIYKLHLLKLKMFYQLATVSTLRSILKVASSVSVLKFDSESLRVFYLNVL